MDFDIIDGGSVVGIAPLSDAAQQWWGDNVYEAESWQKRGGFVYGDWRTMRFIIDQFHSAGLTSTIKEEAS